MQVRALPAHACNSTPRHCVGAPQPCLQAIKSAPVVHKPSGPSTSVMPAAPVVKAAPAKPSEPAAPTAEPEAPMKPKQAKLTARAPPAARPAPVPSGKENAAPATVATAPAAPKVE